MLADSRLDAFAQIRYLLNSMVAPIQYLADVPRVMFDGAYERFNIRQDYIESTRALKRKVLRLRNELLLLDQYREENQRLEKASRLVFYS